MVNGKNKISENVSAYNLLKEHAFVDKLVFTWYNKIKRIRRETMTELRMKEYGGVRSSKIVRFVDDEREITLEGPFKQIYIACHNQKVYYYSRVCDGDCKMEFHGSIDERLI